MTNVFDCEIVICEFEFQWAYYIHFRFNTIAEGFIPRMPPAMGCIVSLLPFYQDGFASE